MEQRNDGGQAFPLHSTTSGMEGMSLRDYFAAKALPGVHAEYLQMLRGADLTRDDYRNMAADAYTLADAMLKARGE